MNRRQGYLASWRCGVCWVVGAAMVAGAGPARAQIQPVDERRVGPPPFGETDGRPAFMSRTGPANTSRAGDSLVTAVLRTPCERRNS
jgi:hypothetical protein